MGSWIMSRFIFLSTSGVFIVLKRVITCCIFTDHRNFIRAVYVDYDPLSLVALGTAA
jgi:hypothetical protein